MISPAQPANHGDLPEIMEETEMEKIDVSYRPHPEYRYWLNDPEGDGLTYYRPQEARDAAAERAIGCYLDDGWAPEVEYVSAGEVTHFAQVLNKTMRPADEDLENGYDDDGMDWPDGMDWRGNYALEPLALEGWLEMRRST